MMQGMEGTEGHQGCLTFRWVSLMLLGKGSRAGIKLVVSRASSQMDCSQMQRWNAVERIGRFRDEMCSHAVHMRQQHGEYLEHQLGFVRGEERGTGIASPEGVDGDGKRALIKANPKYLLNCF